MRYRPKLQNWLRQFKFKTTLMKTLKNDKNNNYKYYNYPPNRRVRPVSIIYSQYRRVIIRRFRHSIGLSRTTPRIPVFDCNSRLRNLSKYNNYKYHIKKLSIILDALYTKMTPCVTPQDKRWHI